MTQAEALRRIEFAPQYTEAEVKEAVEECLQGKHGEFASRVLWAIYKERR